VKAEETTVTPKDRPSTTPVRVVVR